MFQVRREFQAGGASEAVMALKKLCQFTKKLVVTEAEEEGVKITVTCIIVIIIIIALIIIITSDYGYYQRTFINLMILFNH